ncbi:MAG: YmdB family metallophosphoesterase [Oscillospiraceae bacterium]|nr:YmdB family metallophosphoesterase [Oscillospiraceae bacterium]
MNILAVGDVCSRAGIDFLCANLPAFRRFKNVAFCVVNGENANGLGIMPSVADELMTHGADVVTLGNHTFALRQIAQYLDENRYILRPSNITPRAQGRGFGVFDSPFGDVCVVNLIGRVAMEPNESPKIELERVLKLPEVRECRFVFVDFHAEATSEKLALAHSVDGRVTAFWGTHTHVQTNDAQILPHGTGYITDVGMTGAIHSVIGMRVEASIERLFGDPTAKHEAADGPAKLEGALFEVDTETGQCVSAETVRLV